MKKKEKKLKGEIPVYGISEFNDPDKELFYSNDLPTHLRTHHFINFPHRHSTYITILFTEGRGEHIIDFRIWPVKPGSVFFLIPGQVHCWNLSTDINGYIIFHGSDFFEEQYVKKRMNDFPVFRGNGIPFLKLKKSNQDEISYLFKQIIKTHKTKTEYKNQKIISLTDLLYLQLSELYLNSNSKAINLDVNHKKLSTLLTLIDTNYKSIKSPSSYADMMNLSMRHLNRICIEALNKSTGELIFDRIILEAKRILIHKDISISEAADELGYIDTSYFTRLFKKKVGESPNEFRKNNISPF